MDTQKIVAEIDAELSRLHQVKALLTGTTTAENRKSGRNSMAGSSGKKRTLSAEARRGSQQRRERVGRSRRKPRRKQGKPLQCQPARRAPDQTLLQRARKSAR